MPLLKIMDRTGHSTIDLSTATKVEIDEAMARVNTMLASGGRVATRKAGETDYTVSKTFDPTKDDSLVFPHNVGG